MYFLKLFLIRVLTSCRPCTVILQPIVQLFFEFASYTHFRQKNKYLKIHVMRMKLENQNRTRNWPLAIVAEGGADPKNKSLF